VVSGVAGAELGTSVILILGLANLLADGFSMATGAYLSNKSEQEYYRKEWERESWEVEHFPDGERAELQEVYRQRGYAEDEARQLVDIQSREPKRWVKAMMLDELGMMEDESKPLINGLVTFGSFVIAGAVPLLIYLLGLAFPIPSQVAFRGDCTGWRSSGWAATVTNSTRSQWAGNACRWAGSRRGSERNRRVTMTESSLQPNAVRLRRLPSSFLDCCSWRSSHWGSAGLAGTGEGSASGG
jgi:hypothetical protein